MEPADEDRIRLRLRIAYDGTDFSGWARQTGRRTVQDSLEGALAVVLRLNRPPALTVAGRTDAGVHARGQVAHVDVPRSAWLATPGRSARPPGEALARRLGGVLPDDVRVQAAGVAPPGFDARFSALWRRYTYRLSDAVGGVDPLRRRDVVWHPRPLDPTAMHAACPGLLGEHDFAAYCRRRAGASTVRHLVELRAHRDRDGLIALTVRADAFCHNMVRALAGALVAVGEGRRDTGWPRTVLAARRRDPAVNVAPPHGLTLDEVGYPGDDALAEQAERTRRPREQQSLRGWGADLAR